MTQVFERETFTGFYDHNSGRTFADLEFRRCSFEGSAISITHDPRRRSTIRNVKVIQCEEVGCSLGPAVVEDVLVDGLKTSGLFQTWGAVFKHVVIRGRIGRVMLSPVVSAGLATPAQQRAFDEANAAYYATVDWALDIRDAAAEELDIRGIPPTLIRRDPATQVVVTRERALEGRWRQLDLSQTYWPGVLQNFLDDGEPWILLVAPKRHWKFRQLAEGLRLLREAGVTEPDAPPGSGGLGLGSSAVEPVTRATHEEDQLWRGVAAAGVRVGVGEPAPDPELMEALSARDPALRELAAEALGESGASQAVAALLASLSDPSAMVRGAAAEALGKIGDGGAIDGLLRALGDPDASVRASAARALGRIGAHDALARLEALANDREEDEDVRSAACEALDQLHDL